MIFRKHPHTKHSFIKLMTLYQPLLKGRHKKVCYGIVMLYETNVNDLYQYMLLIIVNSLLCNDKR